MDPDVSERIIKDAFAEKTKRQRVTDAAVDLIGKLIVVSGGILIVTLIWAAIAWLIRTMF